MDAIGWVGGDRDEFPSQVKRALAQRVAYLCSNPGCRTLTTGPQVDPERALNIGVAAHITAAASGGPRFDPTLLRNERRSIGNGIWLCQNCGKLVDNDRGRFTESILREWKALAEQQALDQIGLTQKPSASKRAVLWSVPFPRNHYFTGREDNLNKIRSQLNEQRTAGVIQAVTGLGGIGKTQTAVEYAYRYGDAYDAVLWVTADSLDQIRSDFLSIARLLDLPGTNSKDPQIAIASVMGWLGNTERWLLIVDNADDPALVRPFLPPRPRGHIIITSRVTTLDELNVFSPILLEVMDPPTAVAFLMTRTASDQDDSAELAAATELSKDLGYLPLALEQAGAYIAETGCLIQKYLKSFRKRSLLLLQESFPATGAYAKTVLSTWALNFEEVQRISPASADVLRFLCFLAPDFVPEELLIGGAKELGPAISEKLAAFKNDPVLLDDLLRPLVRYALVSRDKKSRAINVHRLVQAVHREQMFEVDRREWARKAGRALNNVFPEASYDQWPLCDRLLPHAKIASDYVAEFSLGYDDVGFLLNEAAAFMRLRADFHGSQRMHAQSLSIRQRDLPADHPAVAESLNDSAFVFLDLYSYEDAEPLFRRAMEICHRVLPENDPQQALHLNNLGRLYVLMGKCATALPLLKRAEEIMQRASDDDLYMYAVVLNSLAELHLKMGHVTEAEAECRRSLSIREKIGNDEKLARSFVTLGEIQSIQGDTKTAEDSFIKALRLKSAVHGAEHPELIPVIMRYASLLSRLDRLEEARELESRAERICSRFGLPRYVEPGCTE